MAYLDCFVTSQEPTRLTTAAGSTVVVALLAALAVLEVLAVGGLTMLTLRSDGFLGASDLAMLTLSCRAAGFVEVKASAMLTLSWRAAGSFA